MKLGLLTYNLLFVSSLPILIPLVKISSKKRGGFKVASHLLVKADFKNKIILHAASIGEVSSLKPLIGAFENSELAITTFTDYGAEHARRMYSLPVSTIPFDILPLTKRFVRRVAPRAFLIYETEIWPSLIFSLNEAGVPVFFVSGKVSEKTYDRLKKFSFLKEILSKTHFLARSEGDAQRARALGFKDVKVVGDLKLDVKPPEKIPELYVEGKRRILIWASTHEGEEEIALKVHAQLRKEVKGLLTVIAPRHVKRAKGLKIPFKHAFRSQSKVVGKDCEVYVIDTIGELFGLYSYADVAVIGGSFVKNVGGHNPVEPAVFAKPVLIGPYAYSFKDVVRRLNIKEVDEKSVLSELKLLLLNESLAKKLSESIYSSYLSNRGTSLRIKEEVESELRRA